MNDHVYSEGFYDYIDAGSRSSGRVVSRLLRTQLRIDSLLDVGAGHGAWAAEWMAAGVADVMAVDGDYVAPNRLVIPPERFLAHDLSQPLDLKRKFDLVQSLEVAEHLPEEAADRFVASLARHADIVLFSAAVPHQGGEHHVNEQPLEYWRKKFGKLGYSPYDWLRPKLAGNREVMPWYRFNTLLYANASGHERLSPEIAAAKAADHAAVESGGDLQWILRRAIVRFMPFRLVKSVAMTKAALETRLRGQA
jgi:SAM-dependent methyltransferase